MGKSTELVLCIPPRNRLTEGTLMIYLFIQLKLLLTKVATREVPHELWMLWSYSCQIVTPSNIMVQK